MTIITRPNEVYLFGNYYKILGKVKKELASIWPAKQVTGDYTKDSEKYVSSVIWSDQRGGIGLKQMSESKPEDAIRSDWSTCETGFKGHLLLPQLPVLAGTNGNPTATLDDPELLIECANVLYAVFKTDVRTWVDGSASWSASIKTLSATPTDAIVSGGYIFFACGTDFERFNPVGSVWTTGLALAGVAVPSRYWTLWDAKLLVVDNTGLLSYSVDDGVTWTANAQSQLQAGSFNSLGLFFRSTNALVPCLGTKQGMYLLDFDGAVWQETAISFAKQDYAGLGMVIWGDALYFSEGLGVDKYLLSETSVTPVGLDKDYGLPAAYRGHIIKLINERNHLYALVDATAEAAQDMFSGSMLSWDGMFNDNEGYSAIFKYNGIGWIYVAGSDSTDAPIKCGIVATADDEYRLWYGMNKKVYYLPLKRELQNPLEVPEHNYATGGQHYYPIFDADNAVVQKTALKLTTSAKFSQTGQYARFYIDWDGGGIWYQPTWDNGNPHINTTGISYTTDFPNSGAFRNWQLQFWSYQGTDVAKSPDIEWVRLDYMKVPETRYQYSMLIDCSKDYRHKRASTLATALETAKTTTTLGDFMYRSYPGVTESKKVSVLNIKGSDDTGKVRSGQYLVTVLEP